MLIFSLLLAATPADQFHTLRDQILTQLLADEPQGARLLGMHDYDGKVQKFDAASLKAQTWHLHDARARAVGKRSKTKTSRPTTCSTFAFCATS